LSDPKPTAERRRLWTSPWGFQESFVLVFSALGGGFFAEWFVGPPDLSHLSWPYNLYIALFLIGSSCLCLPLKKFRPVKYLTSVPLSTALIVVMGLLTLAMGFIPQVQVPYQPPENLTLLGRLGFDHLTSSWPFIGLYLAILISLGATVIVRLSRRRAVFFANHLGLWLLLLAAGLGASDRIREIMLVPEGGLEWRARRNDGQIVEMPLAIRLDDFDIDEYPAKLAVIDHETGMALTQDERLLSWQLDPMEPRGRLLDYDVELLEFLPDAVPAGPDIFVKAIARATVQAARVKASNRGTGDVFEGWLSTGESFFPPRPLTLDGNRLLAMTRPEPRRFVSKVKVFTREGEEIESRIEVNSPLKAGSWLIYQRNYDTEAGRSSTWSGFELISDPWLPLAEAGLLLWAAGSAGLVIRARKDGA
jgi:hypothetical protein